MSLEALRARLAAVPVAHAEEPPGLSAAIAASERYLASDEAVRSLGVDLYWPKWDSPWWHMLVLFELGEAKRIPLRARDAMVAALDAMPVKIFPIHPGDVPPEVDILRETSCHCALGTMSQVLVATGIDVDRALPWVEPWFVRYQLDDGGLTCDNDAYAKVSAHEQPSSMVGTVPALEAMLVGDPATWSPARTAFVARAAAFLLGREARLGSSSVTNAAEREREPLWRELCFPRLYLYDVLRGLAALARWSEHCGGTLPIAAIHHVVDDLCDRFPYGIVRNGRRSFAGERTRVLGSNGKWARGPASHFELLDVVSVVGAPSPALTAMWNETRGSLLRSIDAGRVIGA